MVAFQRWCLIARVCIMPVCKDQTQKIAETKRRFSCEKSPFRFGDSNESIFSFASKVV